MVMNKHQHDTSRRPTAETCLKERYWSAPWFIQWRGNGGDLLADVKALIFRHPPSSLSARVVLANYRKWCEFELLPVDFHLSANGLQRSILTLNCSHLFSIVFFDFQLFFFIFNCSTILLQRVVQIQTFACRLSSKSKRQTSNIYSYEFFSYKFICSRDFFFIFNCSTIPL